MLGEEPAQLGDEPFRSFLGDDVPGRGDGAGDVGDVRAQRGGRVGGPVRSGADHEHRRKHVVDAETRWQRAWTKPARTPDHHYDAA